MGNLDCMKGATRMIVHQQTHFAYLAQLADQGKLSATAHSWHQLRLCMSLAMPLAWCQAVYKCITYKVGVAS